MIKLPSWHKTGFASNVNDLLSRVRIITRPLGFATRGYSHSALRSLRTSHSFGRPDLASELPLVPRVVHRAQSIDEAMVKFKGRLKFLQYMPLKPVKRGIKIWCRCDSSNGYLCQIDVYVGKDETQPPARSCRRRRHVEN